MAILRMTPSGGTAVDYVLVPFSDGTHVRRPRNQDFNTPFRQGPQSPQALEAYQSLIFPNFSLGIGRERIASDSAHKPDEYRRFFYATADTRWESGVYLPILEQSSTKEDVGAINVVRGSAHFKTNIWIISEGDDSQDINARNYTGASTTWDVASGGGLLNRSGGSVQAVALDIIAHKTKLIGLFADSNDHIAKHSGDGLTWTAASTAITTNLLTNAVTANEDHIANGGGLLADIGGELVAVIWHEDNGTITFFSSTDAGDNWADEAVDIPSAHGPHGVAVMQGIDNEDKLYVGTIEGIWEVDTSPSTWTFRLVFKMFPDDDSCRRMALHSDGALWFAQGVDDTHPPIIYRMFVQTGQRIIERVPNDFSLGDGIPADAAGPVHWMESANGMMYIATGGNVSGDYAHIWCHNGKGWHSVRRHGTANQKIEWIAASAQNDSVPRLHYSVRTGSGTTDLKFLDYPFSDPASGQTIKREASGYIDLPYVDFSHPHENKNVLRVGINGKDFSATTSNQHVNVDYGFASDMGSATARNNTNLGDFLSGTSRITLGSGVGLSARIFGMRANLLRGSTNTNTPVLLDVSIDGFAVLPPTEMFEFMVDTKATDKLLGVPAGTTINNLNTARDETLLLALTYANLGTINVRIPPNAGSLVFSEEIVDMGVSGSNSVDPNQRREGVATVRVVQPIA